MIKETRIYCPICKKEFYSEYYESGSIHHENYTNDRTMHNFVQQFYMDSVRIKDLFLKSIVLDSKDIDISYDIYDCRILWLKQHREMTLASIMENMRPQIKDVYNKITLDKIKEKYKEIEKLQESIIK